MSSASNRSPAAAASASFVNHTKLHAIYVALEASQYTKAIKLCLQQPGNLMAQALLAHSYHKMGHRSACLLVVGQILPPLFPELRLEIQRVLILQQQMQHLQSPSAPDSHSHHPSTSSAPTQAKVTKGQRGKKSNPFSSAPPPRTPPEPNSSIADDDTPDCISRLDVPPPPLPEKWDIVPPQKLQSGEPPNYSTHRLLAADDVLLSTLTQLVRNALGLPLTCFQLLVWAAAVYSHQQQQQQQQPPSPQSMKMWKDAFCAGFHVLVSPRYDSIAAVAETVLAQMQGIAMQLTKQHPAHFSTSWAAQTALWQWERAALKSESSSASERASSQGGGAQLFLRLAQSLALRGLEHPSAKELAAEKVVGAVTSSAVPPSTLVQTEAFLLYLKTLELSGQYEKLLAAVDTRLGECPYATSGTATIETDSVFTESSDSVDGASSPAGHPALVYPPLHVLLDRKARALQDMERYGDARRLIEKKLLNSHPDDWSYWKRHLQCAMGEAGPDEGIGLTEAFVSKQIELIEDHSAKYPLRGPYLMRVEIAAERFRRDAGCHLDKLVQEIVSYGARFAPRAACTFSDLLPYVDILMKDGPSKDDTAPHVYPRDTLLEWIQTIAAPPSSSDAKARREELRTFIFSSQMRYRLVSGVSDEVRLKWMPNWVELLSVWKAFQDFDTVTDDEQKENRPADELILLAIQQMVLPESGSSCTEAVKLQSAASVLEAAMEYSPHNPHLKISALFVYSQLNAAPRAWELFHTLHIKHIQYESLSYLILPILWSGGMYIEAVSVCKDILRLQRAAAQDAGEFSGRAMDNGAFSKAEEFLRFHRRRMNRSLTCLEAKGIILEGAPLYVQEENQRPLGALQGIVGGPEDIDRAYEIVANVLDPFSAFSVLYLSTSANDASENRDFDVLEFEVLTHWPFASPENIVQETKRRGHVQSLLLRSALVKEVTKGPKKGKIVPPNESLRMRARSLLSYARSTKAFCDEADADPQTKISYHFLRMLILECQVLAVVSSGLNPDSPSEEAEDMLSREDVGCTLLYRICNGFEASRLPPLSIPMVSRMLPECIVPIFSLFSMCAEVCDLFGWGKRKRKSKKASEALARVALALSQVIDAMLIPLNSLLDHAAEPNPDRDTIVPELVSESIYATTSYSIVRAQQVAKDRICRVLLDIQSTLQSFDVRD